MKRFLPLLIAVVAIAAAVWYGRQPVLNPDPSHTHQDFAVWVSTGPDAIEQLDFSDPAFMSGHSTDEATHDEEDEYHHPALHLHDNISHVIHSHKPGQTIGEFFASIGATMSTSQMENGQEMQNDCFEWKDVEGVHHQRCSGEFGRTLSMFVNGEPVAYSPDYVLQDGDTFLIVHALDESDIRTAFAAMTHDACLYSKICPWRGDPPEEGCIADPAIPCTE